MKQQVAVVIPYYHKDLSVLERISFQRCKTVLKKYPIILLVPNTMTDVNVPVGDGIVCRKVPAAWLESVKSYNEMMLSLAFYELFLDYTYILIYQLDAFVFGDELERFCMYGYDYIGAPWLHGMKYLKNDCRGVWYVGNGGFSLRKVSACLEVLKNETEIEANVNEDLYFAGCNSENFRVAPKEIALQFSYERDVCECYEMNGRKIPFGCHAWEKYDFGFWKPWMEQCDEEIKALMTKVQVADYVPVASRNFRYLEADRECIEKSIVDLLKNKTENIFVFGAGIWGKECCWLLNRAGDYRIACVDNNSDTWGTEIGDVVVQDPQVLRDNQGKKVCVIIAVKAEEVKGAMLQQLKEWGFVYGEQVVFYNELVAQIEHVMEGIEKC